MDDGASTPDARIQQATVNLFADMNEILGPAGDASVSGTTVPWATATDGSGISHVQFRLKARPAPTPEAPPGGRRPRRSPREVPIRKN